MATSADRSCGLAVLGGGLAGLAIAYYARQHQVPATIYEAREQPGGLCLYSHKLWGVPCDRLSTHVSGGRLNGLDLRQFLRNTVLGRKQDRRTVDGSFFYPTRGIGMLSEALARGAGPNAIRMGVPVTRLRHRRGRIRAITVEGLGRVDVEAVASTIPMDKLAQMMDPPAPARILNSARKLMHRNLILVVHLLRRASVTSAATVYFPNADVPFTRLTEPRNRSAAMSPEGHTSLVAEIPCGPDDRLWKAEDADLLRVVREPLERLGWIRGTEVLGSRVVRLSHAYPVLSLDTEDAAATVRHYLEGFANLALAGRCGRFEYRWIHDVLRQGKNVAEWCAARRGGPPAGRRRLP